MIQTETIEYLIEFLRQRIEPSITAEMQVDDSSVKKDKEAYFCDMFERYIYTQGLGHFMLSESGVLFVYNGRWYEKVGNATFLKTIIKRTMERMRLGLIYQKNSPKKIAEECYDGMENDPAAVFKADRRYIVFNNGVFDVKTGDLLPFGMKYKTDLVMGIDYDPDARLSLWDMKLQQIIPDAGMRSALQMFCGMLLANRDETKFEYAAFIVGPGSNGKSVVAAAIANVFGSELFGKFEPKQLLKNSDAMFNMAALEGMIANFTDDLSKDDISGGMFKRFVSGEEFPARHPYGHTVFKVKAPLMLCCTNEIPATTDDTWGYHRRILPIISTDRKWGEEDKDKDANLVSKLSTPEARIAIFNWIYEGYKRIMANNGNIPFDEVVVEKQRELRDDSNSVRRWMRDMCFIRVVPDAATDPRWKSLTDWHKEYKQYCEDNGDRHPQTAKSLSKLFKEKEFLSRRSAQGIQYCIGVDDSSGWRPEENPYQVAALPQDTELPF